MLTVLIRRRRDLGVKKTTKSSSADFVAMPMQIAIHLISHLMLKQSTFPLNLNFINHSYIHWRSLWIESKFSRFSRIDSLFRYYLHPLNLFLIFLSRRQVNNNFFLAVVPIKSFDSDTLLNTFPKANRDGVVQLTEDLKNQISRWKILTNAFFLSSIP